MESFGKILIEARQEKNIEIETAASDTAISKNFLEALESEDIDKFPSDTYAIGFLRNYAEYLGVDVNQVVTLYRAKRIQNTPTPESLLQRQKRPYIKVIIIISIVLVLAGIGAFFYITYLQQQKRAKEEATLLTNKVTTGKYILTAQPLTKRVYKGDIITVPTAEGDIDLVVAQTLEELHLITPVGTQILELSEEREIDIDGKEGTELIVYLSDISRTDASRGAEVRIMVKDGNSIRYAETDTAAIPNAADITKEKLTIMQDNRAYPFTTSITFRAPCIFRYKVDNQEPIEDYYTTNDLITVQSMNGIRMWVSNINAIKIQVLANSRTHDLEVGKAGQVVVQDIKWVREPDGTYKIAVIDVD